MNRNLSDYLEKRDYEKTAQECILWIQEWFAENGPESPAVIGISGGKDSSTVAALCVKALGKDRVFGVLMPDGVQKDIDASRRVVEHLGIRSAVVDIHSSVEAVKASVAGGMENAAFNTQSLTNIPPRIRMTTLYAVSQTMNGRVSNNCNRSENYVGYSTIFGDAAGDFSPLANLTVAEVKEVGKALGLPREFVEKVPADGLSDKTDEDAFGFTYEQLDTLILTGFCEDQEVREKIEKRHAANLFKLRPMPEFHPES
ncbi:MAG: NAD(+) synthase [Oscillospiraceae bacterium]|nr:NAD(+) synthase [Oscillospiraceae bacterium]